MDALYQMSYGPKNILNKALVCPQRESNPHLFLRTELLYPLSYEGLFGLSSDKKRIAFLDKNGKCVIFLCLTQTKHATIYKENMTHKTPITQIAKKVCPGAITIVATKDLPSLEEFYALAFEGKSISLPKASNEKKEPTKVGGGSGFVVSADGFVITCNHVVQDPECEYTVVISPEKKYKAEVLARDPLVDLAILKIDGKELPIVPMGDSDSIELGENVLAVGNSLGEFDDTISMGIVSGLSRRITAYAGIHAGAANLGGLIQTDAAINPGNSGGCLVNMDGEAIGINTAVVMGAQNIGFAIPINLAKNMIAEVKRFGKIKRPYLGLRYFILNETIAKQNNLPVNNGAIIVRERLGEPAVAPFSPADKAGLREFDIITECDGEKITEQNTLGDVLQRHEIHDEIIFTLIRSNKEIKINIKLEEKV